MGKFCYDNYIRQVGEVKMATKKVEKKTPARSKTTSVAKKKTVKRRKKRQELDTMPGGYIMYLFLIIATAAAIVSISGIILENAIDKTANLNAYEDIFAFVKQCKNVALGIFGIFIVLICWTKFNTKK